MVRVKTVQSNQFWPTKTGPAGPILVTTAVVQPDQKGSVSRAH